MTDTLDELESDWKKALGRVVGEARLQKRVATPELESMVRVLEHLRAHVSTTDEAILRRFVTEGRRTVQSLVTNADYARGETSRALGAAADELNDAVEGFARVFET